MRYRDQRKLKGLRLEGRASASELLSVLGPDAVGLTNQAPDHALTGLAGHDRAGAVVLRLVLDHPAAVSWVALLDCLPISEHPSRTTDSRAARTTRS